MRISRLYYYCIFMCCCLILVQAQARGATVDSKTRISKMPCCKDVCWFCDECPPSYFLDAVVKVGVVYPVTKSLRSTYSSGFPIYELEGNYRTCTGWGVWGNVSYLTKKGHAKVDLENCCECTLDHSNLKSGTRMGLVQFGLGLEYAFDISCNLSANFGIGPTYSYINIKNDSNFGSNKINKSGFGGIIKSGLFYYFYDCFHADLFLDYTFTEFNIKHFDYATISFGVGLGASF